MNDNQLEMRKEEFLSLRKEIENCLAELSNLERDCVIAAATAYAWIATNAHASPIVNTAWLIPVLIPAYGASRSSSIGEQLSTLGRYIRQAEKKLFPGAEGDSSQDGWEHFFQAQRDTTSTPTRKNFWYAFLLVSAVCSLIGYCLSPAYSDATSAADKINFEFERSGSS
jgi:hypothetical protein